VVGVLPDDDVGDQPFGRQATLDQAQWRWCLHERPGAGPAGILGTAHNQHPELGRDHIQPLGHILADGMQRAATAGAASALDIDDRLNPGKALRQ
jgi:hypothetical protein